MPAVVALLLAVGFICAVAAGAAAVIVVLGRRRDAAVARETRRRCSVDHPSVRSDLSPINALVHGTHPFLRVHVPNSKFVHLAGMVEASTGKGRSAVVSSSTTVVRPTSMADEECWTKRTVCGLRWHAMATVDDELGALEASLERGDKLGMDCPICASTAIDEAWDPSISHR